MVPIRFCIEYILSYPQDTENIVHRCNFNTLKSFYLHLFLKTINMIDKFNNLLNKDGNINLYISHNFLINQYQNMIYKTNMCVSLLGITYKMELCSPRIHFILNIIGLDSNCNLDTFQD